MDVVIISKENYKEIPPVCFMKADNPGFKAKEEWLEQRFKEGLKIALLRENNKTHGYIEFTPGEYAWRAVDAKGYTFIQCIWVYPNAKKQQGLGSQLIKAAADEGKPLAVITSEGSFMAEKELFLKNGFSVVEEKGKFQLLTTKGKKVTFTDTDPSKYKELTIIYSKQCPWVNRFILESKPKAKLIELKTAQQAQKAPSIYSVMTIIKDGKILADRYVSNTRFQNILKAL
jgi:hypothetical protein